ncbi:MAG: hypothetical protein LAQ30_21730 [Acidobacteriia bacterium]|nr:hypothetical protein [Terriglobia bacterium]
MSRIVRYEFMGNWLYFWVCCLTIILIPLALLMLINGTVRVEDEMEDPEAFLMAYRAGKVGPG